MMLEFFHLKEAEKEFHQIAVVSGLVINEIMASNFSEVTDQSGEYDDWVELYNGGNSAINLNGFYLSDNENDLTKWSFPNITIQPNDYLIVWWILLGALKVDYIQLIDYLQIRRKYILQILVELLLMQFIL